MCAPRDQRGILSARRESGDEVGRVVMSNIARLTQSALVTLMLAACTTSTASTPAAREPEPTTPAPTSAPGGSAQDFPAIGGVGGSSASGSPGAGGSAVAIGGTSEKMCGGIA